MKVITDAGVIEIGTTETAPTIGLTDYSRRETDDFGVTIVVKRNFSRTMSTRVMVPTANVDALQRQLAALRAKPVQWVADDRFDSLSITGFYKDLSIDLAIPPVSYCTLTIEGLAEGADYADPGTDPATDQRKSTLRLLRPASIDDAVLTSSNVPENDYPAWSASTTYALGARVILSATHRIYESAANGNVGNDPTGAAGQWIDVGPTNRWAMFDQALGSQTERAGSIVVSLDPVDPIDAVALLDVTAASVRVQAPGYDRTLPPAIQPGAVTFLDLPATAGAVTITISGSGTVSAGTLLIGKLLGLGTTEASPTAAITDYSRKETDAFGEVTVVERAWAKRMDVKSLISTAAVDVVAARIANVRATPALWIGDATLESLAIYGFFKDFSIAVDEHVSTLSLSIEGLSTAAKLAPLGADVSWSDIKDDDPAHPKPEDGATVGATPEQVEQIGEAQSTADAAAAAAAAAQAQIAAIEGSISADFSAINAEVDALQGSLSTAQGNIVALQSGQSSLSTSVSNLQSSMTAAQSSISNLQSSVNASLSALNSDVDALETRAAGIAASVSGLNTQVGSINTNVSALTTRIADAEGDIDSLQATVASQGASITANATAITNAQGSLAEYSLRLSSNRRNLLPNGGPEALLRGWAGSATWTVNTNNSEGAYFLCTPTASGTFVLTSDAIPMEASVALTLGYETRNTGATSYCDIQCYDAAGANLMDGGQNAAASGTVWGDRAGRAFTLTTPANTASVRVRLVCVATSASDRARIRQVKLEKGTTWSAYSNDASVAQAFTAISSAEVNVASLQTTVATQGASITSNATAITALTGRTATLETTVSSQGATIGTLQSAVSTANGNIASLTTRVNVSQTNLLSNGGLENGFSGAITSGSFAWSNAPEWGPIATTSTNGTQIFEFADITSVQVGATYWISCDPLALGASSIYCDLLFLDASGNVLLDGGQNSQAGPFNFGANDTRRSLIAVSAVAPSGTTKIRPRVVANVVSNQVAGFRRVKVETGNSWTPFSSEASLFSNWSATNTATASVASLTTTVSTQGASISSAQTAITTLQGSVSSLQTTVSTQGASITSLQSTTSTHTGQIAQHTTDIATANSNISANAQAITTANGNIASLTTRVSSAESSISSQATAITGLTGRTATLETTVSSQGASITSLQTTTSTTSANLATLTTRVNAASTNLLKYGGFESGATGWVVVGGASWGAVNGFWGPFVNTAGLSNGNAGLQSEQFDASPGQAWTASVDAEFLATAGQMYLQMAFLVSGSWTTVGTVYKTLGAGFTSTADGRLRTTQTAPANTTKVRIQFGVVNVTGVNNCGFRQAKLEVGSVMSPYSNEASVYQTIQTLTSATGSLASLSTTVSTQGSSITSLQSSYTSLSGALASLTTRVGTAESSITSLQSASTTQAGQISTLQSTVATQGSSISSNATAITTLQGNVASLTMRVNAAQTNLLVNGGLENGFAGAISDGGFTYGNWGTWGPNASTSTNGQHVFQFSDITQVQVGATYWISCDPLALGGSDICCDLLFLDASGNVLLDGGQNPQNGPFNYSTDDTRRGLIAVSAVAPSGTMRIRARIIGNVVSGATIGFRRVKVEMGASWTGFSSEASIVQSFTAYSGLDSSLATLSSTVSTQGGSITSLQSSFTSLNGTVSSLSSTVSAQGTSISTLQSASSTQSGLIATLQTQIVLGGNLLQNTDFAVDTSGWFFNQSGSSHTGARDLLGDAYRLPNEHTLGIRQGDTNSTAYAFWQSTAVAVEPGKYYEASCLATNVNANLTIYLRYQDANGGTVQDFTAAKTSDSQGATLSAFLPLFRRGLAPAGATKAVVILLKNSTKAGSESYGWFTRPQLAQVPGLTGGPVAYSPGSASTTISTQATALSNATSSLASLTTTVNTQGATISSQATAISTLQGQQSSLSSTVSAQGASITSLQTATSTLQGNVANLTTRVAASSPNLLPNGGLENGFASGVGSAGGYSFAISADWGPIATTTATGTQVFQFAPVAANAGRIYTLACDSVCTGSGSTVYCDMLFRNAAGDILLDSAQNVLTNISDFDTTSGRRSQIAITATAPTGATNLVCRFVGVAQNGGTVGFRQMKLERGSTWSPYSAEASITQSFSTLSTLTTQYASLSSTVATQGASISSQATAITTLQGNYASLSSTVSTLNASVATQQSAITDLQGRTSAYWQVTAVAGGRAQLRVYADSNGGGGVDIVGDLRVTGNALIDGTVNPEALALQRFVKRLGPTSISATNTIGSLYSGTLGQTLANGSYLLEGTVGFTYTCGRQTSTYNGKPYYIDYLNDGGVLVRLYKNGTLIASTGWSGPTQTSYGSMAYGSAMTTNFDAPAADTLTGDVTIEVVSFKGNVDTGIVNQGDYYTRQVSGSYSNFSFSNLKLKWTFI